MCQVACLAKCDNQMIESNFGIAPLLALKNRHDFSLDVDREYFGLTHFDAGQQLAQR